MFNSSTTIGPWPSSAPPTKEPPGPGGALGPSSGPNATVAESLEDLMDNNFRNTTLMLLDPITTTSSFISTATSKLTSKLAASAANLFRSEPLPANLALTSGSLSTEDYSSSSTYNDSDDFYDWWSNTTTEAPPGSAQDYNYWALLFIIFPLFTVFGNVLVILSVKRERSLHNVTNYFIVSLAVADLLVAALAMPFAVCFLFLDFQWGLPPIFCDFYIAMDVVCSTSSICNLVAISIDRFIAVTQPIKYAKHKSNTRVWITLVFVWVFSALVGSPIVLGLNTPPEGVPRDETDCSFHNKYFVFFSSLCSFYIPCAILVVLYYRIFKVIHERAHKQMHGSGAGGGKKAAVSSSGAGKSGGATVIENLAQTKRLAETTLGGPSTAATPTKMTAVVDEDKLTNTGSGSQDEDKDDVDDNSPDSDDCHIIPNNQASSVFVLETVPDGDRSAGTRCSEPNGNHDSGYAASNLEEAGAGPEPSPGPATADSSKRNGLLSPGEDESRKRGGVSSGVILSSPVIEGATSGNGNKKVASRFTICKVHKASRKKREKSSAKRERKATKTLAIVLGLFLICWLPFFTCNITDALCTLMKKECSPSLGVFLTTTWLGYVNSCLNPVIYTIFNPEFRKAFKKIMGFKT